MALTHAWLTPLILLITILTLYAVNPNPSNLLHHFVFLSYAITPSTSSPETPIEYSKGCYDLAFVAFYTLLLTFTREFIMQWLLRPLALSYNITTPSKQARFMEQSYTVLYHGILGFTSLFIMSRTPTWYFDIPALYENFPHKTMSAEFKFYYLFQASYWAQQVGVIGLRLEKPRKDF